MEKHWTKWIIRILFIFSGCMMFSLQAMAENIHLTIAALPDGKHEYFQALLQKSLDAAGHEVTFTLKEGMSQPRIVRMLDTGQISLRWLLQNKKRDQKYTPVEVGITNGLIGRRVLFIPKNKQNLYEGVQTLKDFRKLGLIGAFGKNWFDVNVWQANKLEYIEIEGEWRVIYKMLSKGNRGVDYFSRGVNEILEEAKFHPYLDIEKKLLLIYDRDYRFYLSKSAKQYKKTLEAALRKAKKSGLMEKLVRQYWGKDLKQLDVDRRVAIYLKTP